MPAGWTLSTVERVGDVQLGLQRSPDRRTGRYSTKYLRAANIASEGFDLSDVFEMDFTPHERETYQLNYGDVVLTEASGSARQVGRAAIWRDEIPQCCFQNTVIRFRPHATTPEYAIAVFRHFMANGTFARTARGVGIQHLGGSRFAKLPFPLAPLEEQRRIAATVDQRTTALREADRALRVALRVLNDQDREILAAAVSGELVESEAVLARRQSRSYETATALLHRLRPAVAVQESLLTRPRAKQSDARAHAQVPEGWAWVRVSHAGEVRLGKQLSSRDARGRRVPYFRVANVLEDFIDTSDVKEMVFTEAEATKYRLEQGDILLNEGQSIELVGRPAMFRNELPEACFQNALVRFRAAAFVLPEYALLVFRHYLRSGEFQRTARRSTNIAHLGSERFGSLPFPLPPLYEQERLVGEAHRRLGASKVQRGFVMASLARMPQLERDILEAAIAGELVEQRSTEESAQQFLERVGSPPSSHRTPKLAGPEEPRIMAARRATKDDGPAKVPLAVILRQAGRPMRLSELFTMAVYDPDSTEHVELFYLKLRGELKDALRIVDGTGEDAVVEARPDAS